MPIDALKALGGRRSAADRDKTVPSPHQPVAGDEPLTWSKDLALVAIGDRDLTKPASELGRSLNMVGKACGPGRKLRIGCERLASVPRARTLAFIQGRVRILAER